MKLKLLAVLALSLALLLTACGGGEATTDAPASNSATIEVVQQDIYYGSSPTNAENPPVWTVPAGATVTVNLTNNGGLEHNWAIVKSGSEVPAVFNAEENSDIILEETGLVAPGSTYSDVFVAPAAGEYTVICTVAGHYPSMQGRLVVTGQ